MKILNPSSAPLTLSEVSHHLSTHPVRKSDPRVGAYPIVDLSRYKTVRKEVERYVATCTPWCTPRTGAKEGGREEVMEKLVQALKPWGLSWAEVMMVWDLGIARDRRNGGGVGMDVEGEEQQKMEEMRESDERVLGCVFEEGRFEESELKQIVEVVEEALRGADGGLDGNTGVAVVEVEALQSVEEDVKALEEGRRVTRSTTKQARDQKEEPEEWRDPMEAVPANLVSRASKQRTEPTTGQDEGKTIINNYKLRKSRQSYDGAEDEGDEDDDAEDMLVDEQAAVSRELSED